MVAVLSFIAGHFTMAFLFYFNHRYSFHGRAAKGLRRWRRVHTDHHRREHIEGWARDMIPWWGWLVFAALCSPFALLSIPFAIGLYSYVLLYEIAHFACHSHYWWSLPFTTHHLYHHYLDSSKNHATFYGFIDRLFGTYQEVSCDDEQVIHSRLYGD